MGTLRLKSDGGNTRHGSLTGISVSALLGLGLGASVALAGLSAGTGVVGSKHDLNMLNPGSDPYGRVCNFCHTPHHALQDTTTDYLPLWSHQLTTLTFTAYQSATLNADVTDPIAKSSRLCMSCHDGVIAVDQHLNITGTAIRSGDSFGEMAVGGGGGLDNDHPIGFDYASVAANDTGIKPQTEAFLGNSKGMKILDALTDGIMTCSTCHEVHNKDNVADAGSTYNFFLYAPLTGSQICLSCHDK